VPHERQTQRPRRVLEERRDAGGALLARRLDHLAFDGDELVAGDRAAGEVAGLRDGLEADPRPGAGLGDALDLDAEGTVDLERVREGLRAREGKLWFFLKWQLLGRGKKDDAGPQQRRHLGSQDAPQPPVAPDLVAPGLRRVKGGQGLPLVALLEAD